MANGDLRQGIHSSILCERIELHGGPVTRATLPGGEVRYSAEAMVSWRVGERAVWRRGMLLGFSETMGPAVRGTVAADRDTVSVEDGRSDSGRWRHLDLVAVQASSSSLQLSLPGDGLVQLRFLDDSPRRWEMLMRRLIGEAYERAGWGGVVEFQPRIVTR